MVQYTIGGPDGFFGSLTTTICHKMFVEKLAETHTHTHMHTHTHTHTHRLTALCLGLPG